MAERNWGGGNDLSGLFSGIIDQFLNEVESSTNRAIRKTQADQAAEDSEVFDKWNNGLINDQDWLNYIEKRLKDTEGGEDKEEHQSWVETYRKHKQAIEDGSIESRYQEGSITIHDVIGYYKGRMDDAERASPEYREVADRYYGFVDRRDGDYIDEQSAIIVDRIERGSASYSDLLNFYEGMAGKVRSSSTLSAQIRRQILNIRQIVDGVGLSGGSGGGGGSRGGRSGGSGGSAGDGDVSTAIGRANDLVTQQYRLGNVFVPNGSAIVQSTFDMFDIENTSAAILNAMEADSRYIEDMMQRWVDDPEDPTLRTAFGQNIANNAENRWTIYNQAIATYDMRVALLNGLGKPDQAAIVNGYRESFVDKVMETDNSIGAQDRWGLRREVFNQSMSLAETVQNPEDALRMYESGAKAFAKAARNLYGKSDRALPEFKLDEDLLEELHYAEQMGDFIADARNMDPEEIQTVGSMLLDTRPEGFWMDETRITELVGSTEGPTGSGLAGKAAGRAGYRATVDVRNGNVATVEPWVYVSKPGQSTPTLVKKSAVAEFLGIEDGDWMANTRPFAERLSLKEEPVIVYRALEERKAETWWQDKHDKWVPESKVAEMGRDAKAIAEAGWHQEPIPELAGWKTVIDAQGNDWFVDPEDGQLYERLPFRGGINGSFDPSDLVDGSGKLNLERVQGARGLVMGVGSGVNLKWAQRLLERAAASEEVDLGLYYDRDVGTGRTNYNSMQIEDIDGMFWSQADAANQRWQDASRNVARREGEKSDPRRLLAVRNDERRKAAVREWFDNTKESGMDINIARRKTLDNAVSSAIDLGARQAGVVIGRTQRPVDQGPVPVKQFEIAKPKAAPMAPITLDAVRPPAMDPKVLTPPRLAPPVSLPAPSPVRATNPAKRVAAPIKRATSRNPVAR